jgi:hypothetical protein
VSRYTFSLAGPGDDAELRARMAVDRMEGDIAVSFRREPSYFAGCALLGDAAQIIKCTDSATGRIVGLGGRYRTLAHVNGQPREIGYLADLRGDAAHRGGTLLARGYRFLRALHEADPLPLYFSVVLQGNQSALDSLVGGRAGLPIYTPAGRMLTPALHLDLPRRPLRAPGVSFARGDAAQAGELLAFANAGMARRQFAPVLRARDFAPGGRLQSLRWEDFFVARRAGRIVATLAAWDQAAIRQTHIERYSPRLAALRPLYNLAAAVSPLKALPPVGARVPYLYLCCIAVEDDEPALFAALLRFAYNALRKGSWHYAIAGLHESHPLAAVLDGYRSIPAAGQLFVVRYPGDGGLTPDTRIPHVEMALA